MSRSFTIFLTISCIALLSFKDTLRSVHSLLHRIPNPFHYHSHIHSHSHTHNSIHSHRKFHEHDHQQYTHGHQHLNHQTGEAHSDHASERDHHKHESVKEFPDHDVMEHIGLEKLKDESPAEGDKKSEKDSFKIQWYPGVFYQYHFNVSINALGDYAPGNNNFYFSCLQVPPSPPPEYTFL